MKKKILFLVLSMSLGLSLCACGSSASTSSNDDAADNVFSDAESDTKEAEDTDGSYYSLGDAVSTDKIEFVLVDVQITEKASLELGSDFYTPVDESFDGTVASAEDGYVLVYMTYTIENIGKSDVKSANRTYANGGSISGATGTHHLIDIDWNDGYIFGGSDYCTGVYWIDENTTYGIGYVTGTLGSSSIINDSTMNLPMLSGKQTMRCIFAVPENIAEDETSLNVVVYLPYVDSEDGLSKSTPFTYSIR